VGGEAATAQVTIPATVVGRRDAPPAPRINGLVLAGAGIVKVGAVLGLAAIGVTAVATGHDGMTVNEIVGAILTISGMATAVQWRAVNRA